LLLFYLTRPPPTSTLFPYTTLFRSLPLVKEYREHLKSNVADMKNIGGSHGGAITAALILEEFVDHIPWAHLDIAGPAFAESGMGICPKGGTGFGVRTLLKFLSTV